MVGSVFNLNPCHKPKKGPSTGSNSINQAIKAHHEDSNIIAEEFEIHENQFNDSLLDPTKRLEDHLEVA